MAPLWLGAGEENKIDMLSKYWRLEKGCVSWSSENGTQKNNTRFCELGFLG